MRLGNDRFYKYIRAYGFGERTGIELPGETRGLSKPVDRWSKVSFAAISMGQEIGITPLQLISLVSTIANDGVRVPPRIVAGTIPAAQRRSRPLHQLRARRQLLSAGNRCRARLVHRSEFGDIRGSFPRAVTVSGPSQK